VFLLTAQYFSICCLCFWVEHFQMILLIGIVEHFFNDYASESFVITLYFLKISITPKSESNSFSHISNLYTPIVINFVNGTMFSYECMSNTWRKSKVNKNAYVSNWKSKHLVADHTASDCLVSQLAPQVDDHQKQHQYDHQHLELM